ncbi:hypothetical protein GIB67_015270 [Kingdonia uniflora]|uniref:Uncharacterized protein n=1 Tax=Kingdonia uniflora TaxID=39325 RepID=A0A7J7MSY6_9MAGN|nr:hypothetical protein GIB67_015270 [Kingdonia uniflora]
MVEDDWKEVEEKARLAALHWEEEMSRMAARLMKGICLMVKEEIAELKRKKELRDIHLRIKDLEVEFSMERETSTSLLSSQVELQVQLESAHLREDDARQCNQEFSEGFDKIREVNEDREDQHVKVHFKFVEVSQTVIDLTLQIEMKDAKIEKGLKEHEELKEHAAKHKSQNDALKVKCREADMARYRIQALQRSKEALNWSVKRLVDKDIELKRAQDDLSASEVTVNQLSIALHATDMEFWMVQRICNELNGRVTQLKAKLVQANMHVRNAEAGERSRKRKNEARVSLVQGNVISLSVRIRDLEGDVARIEGHASHSELLWAVIAYFVEEVKRLEFERDTLLDCMLEKGCICKVDIDRGDCMSSMGMDLGPHPAELIEQGRIIVISHAQEFMASRPPIVGERVADNPTAKQYPL